MRWRVALTSRERSPMSYRLGIFLAEIY
jgi:hypothetical protein